MFSEFSQISHCNFLLKVRFQIMKRRYLFAYLKQTHPVEFICYKKVTAWAVYVSKLEQFMFDEFRMEKTMMLNLLH